MTRAASANARCAALWILAVTSPVAAQTPAVSPGAATVFIKVRGNVRSEYTRAWKEAHEQRDVEIGTGSGFVVSPNGLVITNHHVVAESSFVARLQGVDVEVRVETKQVEVVLPPGPGEERGQSILASVVASDPRLDLAVLSIAATDLPFLSLGDSDALDVGQTAIAWGFPLGTRVEVARASVDALPGVSGSRGTVTALRDDDAGQRAYVQTDATLNPGNSGGPLVDEAGHVVGVVRMKLRQASNIGFAVAVNVVKDFLTANGLDTVFPCPRLVSGPLQPAPGKGLRLRAPDGLFDVSPARLRWDTGGAPEEPSLRVDRLATPLDLETLEGRLLAGEEGKPGLRSAGARSLTIGGRPARAGFAQGDEDGSALAYTVLDLGPEKLFARFAASPSCLAFNAGAVRRALEGLEAERLLSAPVRANVAGSLEPASMAARGSPTVLLPGGWVQEPLSASSCPALPPADSGILTSPEGDFTVSFRATWWGTPDRSPIEAAAACSKQRGSRGPASYLRELDLYGVPYAVEGSFFPVAEGLLQLEVEVPRAKRAFVNELFARWLESTPR